MRNANGPRPVRVVATLSLLAWSCATVGEERLPIIDMHLHVRAAAYAGPNPPPMCTPFGTMPRSDPRGGIYEGLTFHRPPCERPIPAATSDAQVMRDTLEVMERRNIFGMVSGEPQAVAAWRAAARERIIPGVDLRLPGTSGVSHVAARSPDELRALHSAGALRVLGEVMAQYEGIAANDPRLEPYWALAEELDVPVGIHLGPGEPGTPYAGQGYRARLGSPLLLEDVLVRHPRLRVYVMHAGYPLVDELRALLFSHPQVYVDVASIVYTEPRAAFYRFLEQIVAAGYGDRVMFGSDQMIWPGVIEPAIATIEEAPFLTPEQKRDILYHNAARFLRLTPAEIEAHYAAGRGPR